MSAQLKTALLRSLWPALLAALGTAGAAVGQVQVGADPTQVGITIGLGALSAAVIVLIRGLVEGLSDGQRAALGKVLASDVTPTVLTDTSALLVPLATQALQKAGMKVTDTQVQAVAQAATRTVEHALTEALAAQTGPVDPKLLEPPVQPAATAAPKANFVPDAVAPPEHTPAEMLPSTADAPDPKAAGTGTVTVNDQSTSA